MEVVDKHLVDAVLLVHNLVVNMEGGSLDFESWDILDSVVLAMVDVDTYCIDHVDRAAGFADQLLDMDFD